MSRFWNDDVYKQFYESSAAEKALMNNSQKKAGGNLAPGDFWEPTRKQIEQFQRCFAEWSQGRGSLAEFDFRRFLLDLKVELTVAQAKCLWQEVVPSGSTRLEYAQALAAYRKVMEAPVDFKASNGAAPPGRELEELPAAASDAADLNSMMFKNAIEKRPKVLDVGLGPGLPLSDAKNFLLEEGLPTSEIDSLIEPFVANGAVPQAMLFDFLAERSAGTEVELEAPVPVQEKPKMKDYWAPRPRERERGLNERVLQAKVR
eukprot:TRINITY_DN30022_c0_g1_i1.p1 TRINITY_DN30022_c0_g1~~TRINITY_DN30022_c0_g1_i1.p1  ORF type:complete len:260 (-),score=75.66 TRINITY_DN30022_c0_g1_i1:187-966(-)